MYYARAKSQGSLVTTTAENLEFFAC